MAPVVKLLNKAIILHQQGNFHDAKLIYEKVLHVHPKTFHALHGLGIIYAQSGSFEEAERLLSKALSVDPKNASCFHSYGTVLAKLGRFEDAVESYNNTIKLAPNCVPIVHSDRGTALFELNCYDEALVACDKALALKSDLAEAWLCRGNISRELKRYDEALSAYDKALRSKPALAEAWLGRGNVFLELKNLGEATIAYEKALTLNPRLAPAWVGRGNVFAEQKRHNEAIVAYDKALTFKRDLVSAWIGLANSFTDLKLYVEALDACNKALSLEPNLTGLEGVRIHIKMQICDWQSFDAECLHLISSVIEGNAAAPPFALLSIQSSSSDQLKCANLWVEQKFPPSQRVVWGGERYKHDRIRVGYVSADFRQHATADLMAGLFEHHDRSRFETTAISVGPNDNSAMRQRLLRSFDHFIDATTLSDLEVASLIKDGEIDLLIDLKGFTQETRELIFLLNGLPPFK